MPRRNCPVCRKSMRYERVAGWEIPTDGTTIRTLFGNVSETEKRKFKAGVVVWKCLPCKQVWVWSKTLKGFYRYPEKDDKIY